MPRKITKLTLNEISMVDKPAMEGAIIAIQKRYKEAGRETPKRILLEKAEPELYKSLDISAHLYVWDICCDWDVEWAVSRLTEVADVDLPFIAKYIAARAEALGVTDLLPTKGVFANLVKKEKGKGKPKTKKEAPMPKTAEELQKELEAAQAKIAALEKKEEGDPTPEPTADPKPEVYKAADGTEYTGESAALAKRLDAEKADRELEKRAEALPHIAGDLEFRKNLLKSIDSMPDEEQRKKANEMLKERNSNLAAAFSPAGDSGSNPEANDADEAFNKAMDENPNAKPTDVFIKTHRNWRPAHGSAAIPAQH